MSKLYQYTIFKQDGTVETLEPRKRMELNELYAQLNCSTVQIVPTDYYNKKGWGKCTVFVDEEGRLNLGWDAPANPHFHNLGDNFYIVGDALREKVYHPEAVA